MTSLQGQYRYSLWEAKSGFQFNRRTDETWYMSSGLKLPHKDKNNLVNETFFVKEPVIHDVYKTINNMQIKNINKIIIATLNVNSIRGKFEQLKTITFWKY